MAPYLFRWRSRPDIAQLEQAIDQVRTELIRTRRQLTNKAGYAAKLELVLHQRTERIDQLHHRIDTLRAANRKLEAEADHYAALLAAPPADTAPMLAAK